MKRLVLLSLLIVSMPLYAMKKPQEGGKSSDHTYLAIRPVFKQTPAAPITASEFRRQINELALNTALAEKEKQKEQI